MRGRRGFSMVELAISLALVSLLSTSLVGLFRSWTAVSNSITLRTQRELDTRRAALRIFQAARTGSKILPDQTGLRLRDGSEVRLRNGRISLHGHSLLREPVVDFLVIRREGRLRLTFELEGPRRYQGPSQRLRLEYQEEARR